MPGDRGAARGDVHALVGRGRRGGAARRARRRSTPFGWCPAGRCARCWRRRRPTWRLPLERHGRRLPRRPEARRDPRAGAPLRRRRHRGCSPAASTTSPTGCRRSSRRCRPSPVSTASSSTARSSRCAPTGGPGPSRRPRPAPAARVGAGAARADARSPSCFFDVLHLDGTRPLDTPGAERLAALAGCVPAALLVAARRHRLRREADGVLRRQRSPPVTRASS